MDGMDELISLMRSGIFNSNNVDLPPGAVRSHGIGYDQVTIPVVPTMTDNELIPIQKLPKFLHGAFKGYTTLNAVQSKMCKCILTSDENILLCAPTGAGKTDVAVLCILREFAKHLDAQETLRLNEFKIIYVAPMKSLVHEIVLCFQQKLKSYGVTVIEMTGDTRINKEDFSEAQIIVCTPEKYDVITRRGDERARNQLLIIDEIHLLNNDRGPVLEAIAVRTLIQNDVLPEKTRIVGLSATLPNYVEVARFLQVAETHMFNFDSNFRPVPLEQCFIGLTSMNAMQRLRVALRLINNEIKELQKGEQILIFVHSRKETVKIALELVGMLKCDRDYMLSWQDGLSYLKGELTKAENNELALAMKLGIGIHHAGLPQTDRHLVENLFREHHLPILVCTATLAWGVNLPAHTVIIYGTRVYKPEKSKFIDIDPIDVLQMFGRAGRPQYDSSGRAVLITQTQNLSQYVNLTCKAAPIESCLGERLNDVLNAEIVLGTVTNISEAVTWLKKTFYYTRILSNPTKYNIFKASNMDIQDAAAEHCMKMITLALKQLSTSKLIIYDSITGVVKRTELGRIASVFYCSYESMQLFECDIHPNMSTMKVLEMFARSNEFRQVTEHKNQAEYEKLVQQVKIPLSGHLSNNTNKVIVLLQAYISAIRVHDYCLQTDITFITQSARRILAAVVEIALSRKYLDLAKRTLSLLKMINRQTWESDHPLRQFKSLDEKTLLCVCDHPIDKLRSMTSEEMKSLIDEEHVKIVRECIRQIPYFDLHVDILKISDSQIFLDIIMIAKFVWNKELHGNIENFLLFVEDAANGSLIYYESFALRHDSYDRPYTVKKEIDANLTSSSYVVRVLNDEWFGSEVSSSIHV